MSRATLDRSAIEAFGNDLKIAVLATVDDDGLPHATLITSLEAKSATELMFGQFSEGESKRHLRERPEAAFAVLTADRRVWRGRARWTREAKSGADYEHYNHKPMFRYNAYFGIHTIHYLDLIDVDPESSVPLMGLALGTLGGALRGQTADCADDESLDATRVLTPWAERHLARAATVCFLTYLDGDKWPVIVPVVPCHNDGDRRLVFTPTVYRTDLEAIEPGSPVAVLALNFDMESVLVRGPLRGFERRRGIRAGVIDIDWVYNSMPPKHGVIYPPRPLHGIHEAN